MCSRISKIVKMIIDMAVGVPHESVQTTPSELLIFTKTFEDDLLVVSNKFDKILYQHIEWLSNICIPVPNAPNHMNRVILYVERTTIFFIRYRLFVD
eukprot:SAG31_NODE_515_length_14710_cov_6.289097_7_plen_97_part_00